MSNDIIFVPIPQERIDRQAADIEKRWANKKRRRAAKYQKLLAKIDPSLANKNLTKELARKIMSNKNIKLGHKIDLYTAITWGQRVRWFPGITIVYFVAAFMILYPIFLFLL